MMPKFFHPPVQNYQKPIFGERPTMLSLIQAFLAAKNQGRHVPGQGQGIANASGFGPSGPTGPSYTGGPSGPTEPSYTQPSYTGPSSTVGPGPQPSVGQTAGPGPSGGGGPSTDFGSPYNTINPIHIGQPSQPSGAQANPYPGDNEGVNNGGMVDLPGTINPLTGKRIPFGLEGVNPPQLSPGLLGGGHDLQHPGAPRRNLTQIRHNLTRLHMQQAENRMRKHRVAHANSTPY